MSEMTPSTTPTPPCDDHVVLLELLGWTGINGSMGMMPDGTIAWLPFLDDDLMRTACEQLLTTEELQEEFIGKLITQVLGTHWCKDSRLVCYSVLSASAADQAAVLVQMFRK